MPKRLQLTAMKFGYFRVVRFRRVLNGDSYWLCRCRCGKSTTVKGSALKLGRSSSCGCRHREIQARLKKVHGMHGTREYRSWATMIQRCESPRNDNWKSYGGRGIRVCRRWRRSFASFYEDMGRRPAGKTLDRRNNDGNYTKRNCRWASPKTQRRNQGFRRCQPSRAS